MSMNHENIFERQSMTELARFSMASQSQSSQGDRHSLEGEPTQDIKEAEAMLLE